jgi:hypothetical protein
MTFPGTTTENTADSTTGINSDTTADEEAVSCPPQRLRVALLVEDGVAAEAVSAAFGAALAASAVDLVCIYTPTAPPARRWTERIFKWVDRIECHLGGQCSANTAGLGAAVLGRLAFSRNNVSLAPDDDAKQQLRDQALDLILCAATVPLTMPAGIARYGAWGLEIGYGVSAFAAIAGAAELAAHSPVAVCRVVDYAGPVARELFVSSIATAPTSIRRTRRKAIQSCAAVLRRMLTLAKGRSGAVASVSGHLPRLLPLPEKYPQAASASPALLLRACLAMGGAWVRRRFDRKRDYNRWHIAYAFTDMPLPEIPFDALRYLAPAPGTFWADPFALVHQGRHYILFEELPYASEVGRLLAIEVFADRDAGAPAVVLQRDYHLSYPHAFHWQGDLYMVPETRGARRVELLRCIDFPSRWELCKVMLDDIGAVDATLWQQDGVWWMFLNVAPEGSDTANELHLYHADSLLGEWTRHPSSPLCADVRCARPAGPLFVANGALYRPSQDCAKTYGHALWLNRVDRLDRTDYAETSVRRIAPDWSPGVSCVHTLGRSGRLTVLDCVLEDHDGLNIQHTANT